jgi:hypothetical protein
MCVGCNPVVSEYSAAPEAGAWARRRDGRIGPMTADFLPLRLLLLTLVGWVNRHQQHVIDYLMEENRVLRAGTGG